ncbi:MAG: Lrp/AsnC ligand binding domain-containing protein [Brevibacterium linens]
MTSAVKKSIPAPRIASLKSKSRLCSGAVPPSAVPLPTVPLVAGEWDFILILLVQDMAEYTELTRQLFFGDDNIRRFSTQVVMDAAKVGLTVPLG